MNIKSIALSCFLIILFASVWTQRPPFTGVGEPDVLAAETAQLVTIEGDGEAAVGNKDTASVRAQALENGLKDAFRKALLEVLPASLSLEVQERIIQKLSENLRSFLLRYRIVSEMPTENLFFMTVEATFSSVLIKRALAKIEGVGRQEEDVHLSDIRLRVEGITSFRWYTEVLNFLRAGLSGVRAVKPVEVFGTTAILSVGFQGEPKGLADQLLSWRPEEFSHQVTVRDREVHLLLTPNTLPREPSSPSSPISVLP